MSGSHDYDSASRRPPSRRRGAGGDDHLHRRRVRRQGLAGNTMTPGDLDLHHRCAEQRLPVHDLAGNGDSAGGRGPGHRRVEVGVEVPHPTSGRHDHRDPVLQGHRQHAEPMSARCGRAPARSSQVSPSLARPRAVGSRPRLRPRCRSLRTRPTWCPTTRRAAATPSPRTTSPRATTRARCTALADGTDGVNGVYRYGTGGGFPTTGYQSSNYWVDVVFTTN